MRTSPLTLTGRWRRSLLCLQERTATGLGTSFGGRATQRSMTPIHIHVLIQGCWLFLISVNVWQITMLRCADIVVFIKHLLKILVFQLLLHPHSADCTCGMAPVLSAESHGNPSRFRTDPIPNLGRQIRTELEPGLEKSNRTRTHAQINRTEPEPCPPRTDPIPNRYHADRIRTRGLMPPTAFHLPQLLTSLRLPP